MPPLLPVSDSPLALRHAVWGLWCCLLAVGLIGQNSVDGPAALAAVAEAVKTIRLPINRDTWVSSVEGERDANLGGSSRLKTKGIQEFFIVDINPSELKGLTIRSATLHLRGRSKEIQHRLTVSTLASAWVEGASTHYQSRPGCTSFNWARQGKQPWAYPGSDITAVINGRGHTLWRFADSTRPDAQQWQAVAVDPAVVAARVAGISHGFVVMDDVGSEYVREGERFRYRLFPNRFVASREAGHDSRPYFTIQVAGSDRRPPKRVGAIHAQSTGLPPGEAVVTWTTPVDRGPAGTVGFFVRVTNQASFHWEQATPVPRYLVPMAGEPGDAVTMRLRDLPYDPGRELIVGIQAVDGAGNAGPVVTQPVRLSSMGPDNPFQQGNAAVQPFVDRGSPLMLGGTQVSVVDPLDKVHPETGRMIPPHHEGYLRANHLWSSADRLVRLHAARNEFVAFQLLLFGPADGVTASLSFTSSPPGVPPPSAVFSDGSPDHPTGSLEADPLGTERDQAPSHTPRVQFFRFINIPTPDGRLPDPVVPISTFQEIEGRVSEKGQPRRVTPVLGEVYVPHEAVAGVHHGVLDLSVEGRSVRIRVALTVWDFTLPDYLSFIPQMNCYGLPDPPVEKSYYRLAHVHRTCLNRLAYNWRGQVRQGCAPKWDGKQFDWRRYDRRYGPLLDGSAFSDLPRQGVPVDAFYLPINENWPMDIHRAFKGSYWVEEAFHPRYREGFVQACRRFAQHFQQRGWHDTFFEFYLNNKVFFKRSGWSSGSAPWIFDEPVNTQDFWALRWYGRAFHEGVTPARGQVKMAFRCDISRPQWQRGLLDHVLDVNVVSGAMRRYRRMVMDRKTQAGQVVYEYGGSNPITRSNVQPAAWCVDAWCLGADGVLPWQTVGKNRSWKQADTLSLFYPGQAVGLNGAVPSVRLKAYRRGQQDVEYLTILSSVMNLPRWALGPVVREALGLDARFEKTHEHDAGRVSYDAVGPVRLWRLRTRVGAMLDELHPAPRRRWVHLQTPVREIVNPPDAPRLARPVVTYPVSSDARE